MKMHKKTFALILLILILIYLPLPQIRCIRSNIVISSCADTWVNNMYLHTKYPEKPHGYLWGMFAGNMYYKSEEIFGSARTYLKFNLSEITSEFQIVSAILKLYIYDVPASPQKFDVHLVNEDWDENRLIWINQPDFYEDIINSTTILPIADRWISWNVTKVVESWHMSKYENYGLMIKANQERNATDELASFYPKENLVGAEFSPKLEIIVEGEKVIPEIPLYIFPLILSIALFIISQISRMPFKK